jgi:hypothetical protein
MDKIVRLKSGALLGCAGSGDDTPLHRMLDTVRSSRRMPNGVQLAEVKAEVAALLLLPSGELWQISVDHDQHKGWHGHAWRNNRGFSGVGSGGRLAIGHLGAGKTPAQAVAFAAGWDANSRLPVHVHHLRAPAKGRTRRKK